MDHDNLHIPTVQGDVYNPAKILPGHDRRRVSRDGPHPQIQSPSPARSIISGSSTASTRRRPIDTGSCSANPWPGRIARPSAWLVKSAALKRIISPEFTATGQAWDSAVAIYLQRSSACPSSWSAEADAVLESRGIPADLRACYLEAIERFAPFLERQAFLYTGELNPPAPKPSGERPPFESSSAGATGSGATSTSTASAADTTTR